jgi:hypothetical protein
MKYRAPVNRMLKSMETTVIVIMCYKLGCGINHVLGKHGEKCGEIPATHTYVLRVSPTFCIVELTPKSQP